jgi:hypothetical protein
MHSLIRFINQVSFIQAFIFYFELFIVYAVLLLMQKAVHKNREDYSKKDADIGMNHVYNVTRC